MTTTILETIVDRFYRDFQELVSYLEKGGELSLRNVVESNFGKVLLLVAASYFEWLITQNLVEFVNQGTNNNKAILEFVKNKALSRQFHSLFDWDRNNANKFYSLFGEEFRAFMKGELDSNNVLDSSVKAFMEIGRERNRLVHQDFGSFALEKTATEIFQLYKEAVHFVESIPIKLEEFCAVAKKLDGSC
jgi:RiboL-PSP-HEPN